MVGITTIVNRKHGCGCIWCMHCARTGWGTTRWQGDGATGAGQTPGTPGASLATRGADSRRLLGYRSWGSWGPHSRAQSLTG